VPGVEVGLGYLGHGGAHSPHRMPGARCPTGYGLAHRGGRGSGQTRPEVSHKPGGFSSYRADHSAPYV